VTLLSSLLAQTGFSDADILALLRLEDETDIAQLRQAAFEVATREVGNSVYCRGLVEISNLCVRDCLYCGIRKSNHAISRYSLDAQTVIEAATWAARTGYGSCVLQAGERQDAAFVRFIEDCVREIKQRTISETLPQGLGITLSLGEQSLETYRRWFNAGAHRYLLRIETSSPALFARIHPREQSIKSRLQALADLASVGFQVGTGVMIGLPEQTLEDLAADIRFFADRDIDMIGMGPYITATGGAMTDESMMPSHDLLQLSLKMIAVTRLVLRDVNIAATTALQTLAADGRERGIAFGANVVMPNMTPVEARANYQLYDGKVCLNESREECSGCLARRILSVGRHVGHNAWGDSKHYGRRNDARDTPKNSLQSRQR
jgi:biotin synthase